MNKVKQMLKVKGGRVWKVSSDATVLDALKLMAEKQIGAVVVMDGERVAGIFSERDFARKVGLFEKSPRSVRVSEVMTTEVITVTPENTVNDCMALMTDKRIRHLPVLENGRLVGLLSIGDIVKDIIEELQFMVEQLEKYITGFR
jgi:CBS domain-containing protein